MSRNVRVLRCTPDDVFRVLADGWLYPCWVVGASRMRDVEEAWPQAGSRLHHSFGAWPALIDDVTVVEVYDPPRRMVVRAKGWPIGEARVTIDVKPRGRAMRRAHPGGGGRGSGALHPGTAAGSAVCTGATPRRCTGSRTWRRGWPSRRSRRRPIGRSATTTGRHEVSASRGHTRGAVLDAVVVGAGPNGLAAAVTLARAGLRVRVYERADQPGGGSATRELTLPGFRHDVCSAVHPMAFESRFFREFGLQQRVEFVTPELSFGHPLDGGRAGIAYRDLARTADELGADGPAYATAHAAARSQASGVADFTGSTLLRVPPDPLLAIAFGLRSLEQGSLAWNARFREDVAPAMLTGVAAHTILPQPSVAAAGAGLAPRGLRARARLAHPGRRQPVDHRRDGRRPPRARRRSDHGPRGDLARGAAASVASRCSTSRPARSSGWRATRCRGDTAARWSGSATAAGSRRSTSRSATRCRGRTPSCAGPARCTSAAPGRRSRPPRTRSTAGASPSAPTCSWRSSRSSTPPAHPTGRHTLWTYTHVPAGSTADRREAVIASDRTVRPRIPRHDPRDELAHGAGRRAAQPELRRG